MAFIVPGEARPCEFVINMHQNILFSSEKPEELLDLVDNAGSVLWALDSRKVWAITPAQIMFFPPMGMLVHAVELD